MCTSANFHRHCEFSAECGRCFRLQFSLLSFVYVSVNLPRAHVILTLADGVPQFRPLPIFVVFLHAFTPRTQNPRFALSEGGEYFSSQQSSPASAVDGSLLEKQVDDNLSF